jgi:epoxyqueuosine reductase
MTTSLIAELERRGYKGRAVPIDRLDDLRRDIRARQDEGCFDGAFSRERLTGLKFEVPADFPEARSLLIVATAQPSVSFSFDWRGRRCELLVPPTYLHWRDADRRVEGVVTRILGPGRHRVESAAVPKKLLAVRSGLADYGRNNLTYVPRMGSFHRLTALLCDAPCGDHDWREPAVLGRCESCNACLKTCPTGAISSDRFLLHAERCVSFCNEEPSSIPFPPWLKPEWHECLVGCLTCQRVCPENEDVLAWVEEGARLSEEETKLLLDGVSLEQLPSVLVEKLARSDLVDLLDVLPRNLHALLDRADPGSARPR